MHARPDIRKSSMAHPKHVKVQFQEHVLNTGLVTYCTTTVPTGPLLNRDGPTLMTTIGRSLLKDIAVEHCVENGLCVKDLDKQLAVCTSWQSAHCYLHAWH